MKKNLKFGTVTLLVLALILAMMPAMAFAADDETGEVGDGVTTEQPSDANADPDADADANADPDADADTNQAGVFTDVPEGYWAYEYIYDILDKGVTTGMTATTFGPDSSMTRAQFVTFLGRLAGVDAAQYASKEVAFTDIDDAAFAYAKGYIIWAAEEEITTGTSAAAFSPAAVINREQVATLVARYAEAAGIELVSGLLNARETKDLSSAFDWATEAITVLVNNGYMNLNDAQNFRPKDNCTRAEMAQVLSLMPEPAAEGTDGGGTDGEGTDGEGTDPEGTDTPTTK